MVSPIPSVIAPRTAPGILPRPPNTELINALLVMAVPSVGKAVYFAPRKMCIRDRINGYLYRNHYCRRQGCRIFIFPIVDEGNCYGYLLLSLDERTDALSPERSIKIQQILAIMKFEIIKSDEIAHTVNRYYDFLLDELVESEQTDFRKLMQKYGLVQKVIYDEYYVLIAGRTPQSTSDTFFHELLTSQQFNALYDLSLIHISSQRL